MAASTTQKVTDADIAREHATGASCNEIAKRLGVAASTISTRAKRLGLTFSTGATAAAVQSHKDRAAAKRAQLELDLLDDADHLRKRLRSPAVRWQWDAKTSTWVSLNLPEPEAAAARDISTAVSNLVGKANDIAKVDVVDDAAAKAGSLIKDLVQGLRDEG